MIDIFNPFWIMAGIILLASGLMIAGGALLRKGR